MRKNTSFSDCSSILRNNRDGVAKLAWEWRIFWHHSAGDRSKFDDFSVLDNQEPEEIVEEENDDIYILLPECEHLNLKLRENEVSVKFHYAAFAAFNAYQKKQTYSFPISPSEFLLLTGLFVQHSIQSAEEFKRIVVWKAPQAKLIAVNKLRKKAKFRRTNHAIDSASKLSGEFSRITINSKMFWTFCLESKNTTWLHDTAARIEIEDGVAVNYCDFLIDIWEKTHLDQEA
jgi:hypothetical protein